MIAPTKISPPPPLQGRPPSHAQGMGPIHGPRSEAARRGSSPLLPDLAAPPAPRGASGRTKGEKERKKENERGRRKRRKFRGHRRRCVLEWSSRGLSVNGPRVPPK